MKHWPTKRLGELCDVGGGDAAPQGDENFTDGTIPFVRMKDLGRYHFTNNLCTTSDKLTEASVATNRMKSFEPGCILFPRSGSVALNHRAILGIRACIVSHIGVLQNLRPEIIPGFLYLYLTTFDMTALSKKTTGVDSIAFADVKKIPIPVPPLAEQERIVHLLDEADELRKLRTLSDRRADALLPALFHEMFGDPVTNDKEWASVRLCDVCDNITDGTHDTPERLSSGVPFITSKNIRPYEFDLTSLDYVSEDTHREIIKRCNPRVGDVLYTNIGVNIGNAVANRLSFAFSMKNVALLQPDSGRLDSFFLEALLNNAPFKKSIIHSSSLGGAQKFVGLAQLRKMSIILPPLPLQQQFAQRVTAIRELEASQAVSRARLDALYQSMLHRAFNGTL